ncbi:hypothetical protein [Bradyrhizobium prioriisuperbiae]|uniref:hypothetical protein n=1 Tax=Bradyrhizobium prioriisuperbiae TaxID=2854389 RepID=UPI0028E5CF82|nr:hypothetical protein [Bradyrhizobium prioritasuperba]
MLWRVTLRRLPILILAYAFALQVIVAGWSGTIHGPANALVDAICSSPRFMSGDVGLASTDPAPDRPSTPSAHHDCALACLNAQGGAFTTADASPLARRDAPVVVMRAVDGAAFQHPGLAFVAFAARAPPRVV